jgi:hypothetical protein
MVLDCVGKTVETRAGVAWTDPQAGCKLRDQQRNCSGAAGDMVSCWRRVRAKEELGALDC